jgi:hypothetical protein
MILKDLEPGDKFVHANSKDKTPKQFIVKGNCLFNSGHGSSTRLCIELKTGAIVGKSCRLEVVKVGESIHKQTFLDKVKTTKP